MENKLKQNIYKAVQEYYQYVYGTPKERSYIPVSGKVLEEDDLLAMIDASLDMWLTTGRFNDEFERSFAKYLDVPYALSTNSGSSANLLAFSALTSHLLGERRLQAGDEVITVATGFPTTVNPIIQHGCIPVFIDCDRTTYNIDVTRIEEAIRPQTKAIMIAHTLGFPFALDEIQALCRKYNLWLIEDSCDALGGEYNNIKLGTHGDIGTYSFYPAHHMTMGEGGAVVTRNATLFRILTSLRDWGRDCWCPSGKDNTCKKRFALQRGTLPFGYDHKYTYSHIGYNLKITDWQAALGCSQLKKLPRFLEQRASHAHFLLNALHNTSPYLTLPIIQEKTKPAWFGFPLSVTENAPFTKQALVEYLENQGIGTRQLFAGNILRQPMMLEYAIPLRIGNSEILSSQMLTEEHYALLPHTEYIVHSTFWIGVHQGITDADCERINTVLHTFLQEYQ